MNWLELVIAFVVGIVTVLAVQMIVLTYMWKHREKYMSKMIKQVMNANR